MDPIIGAGLITAGANVIGSIFGASNNSNANKTNLRISRENNAFTERMWNLNNEYNSPLNQIRLLQEAGLNPITYSDAAASPTAQQVSGNMTANQRGFNPNFDLSDIVNAFIAKEQLSQRDRELDFMRDYYEALADKTREETTGQKYTNQILQIDASWRDKMDEAEYNKLEASTQESLASANRYYQEVEESKSRVRLIDAQKATEDMLRIPRFNQLCAEANLKNAQARESAARTAGFLLDNREKEMILDLSGFGSSDEKMDKEYYEAYKALIKEYNFVLKKNEKESSGLSLEVQKKEKDAKIAAAKANEVESKRQQYISEDKREIDESGAGTFVHYFNYFMQDVVKPILDVGGQSANIYGSVAGGYGLYKQGTKHYPKLPNGFIWPTSNLNGYSVPTPLQ